MVEPVILIPFQIGEDYDIVGFDPRGIGKTE